MRHWLVVLAVVWFGFAPQAEAQIFDTPALRGSSPFIPAPPRHTRWEGGYGGIQLGFARVNPDLTNAFSGVNIFDPAFTLTAPLGPVSNWATLGRPDALSASYGVFFGYTTQWDDAVLGLELNYSHSSVTAHSSAQRCYSDVNTQCLGAITLGDTNAYNATVNATASVRAADYATLRARAGWEISNFLPYVMAGVALARLDVTRTATVNATPTGPGTAFVRTETDHRTRVAVGYALGGGLDYLVTRNWFLRSELEYIWLKPVGDMQLSIITGRIGAGLKF